MKYMVGLVMSVVVLLDVHAEAVKERHLSESEIRKMKEDVESTPINTFRFLGNTLVCKSDSRDDKYACMRIGRIKIGDPHTPRVKPLKELPQPNGVMSAVFPIFANEEHKAYWVIGHKDGKIVSIQLTGNYQREDLSFSTIMLDDPEEKVRWILGPRYIKNKVASINGDMWDYSPFPISVEVVNGKVYSIRVVP